MATPVTNEEFFLHQRALLWINNTGDPATGAIRCYWCRELDAIMADPPRFWFPLCGDCFTRYERCGEPAPPTAWHRTRTKVVRLTPVPDVAEIIDLVTDFLKYKWEP